MAPSQFNRNEFFFCILVTFPYICSIPGLFTIRQYIAEKQSKMIDNYSLMKVSSSATGLSFILG